MDSKIAFPAMVKEYRTLNNLTMEQLAEKLGKTKSTISKWEKGTRSPKIQEIEEIANFFKVEPNIMMFGESPETSPQAAETTLQAITDKVIKLHPERQEVVLEVATEQLEEQERENIMPFAKKSVTEYDYYDQPASAGTGQYLSDSRVEKIELPVEVDADFVVTVDGDSMQPKYQDDDYIFVKLSYNLSNGDVGVFYYNGNAYIKQLRIDGNKAYLHSLNPDYKDMPITEDTDFRMIGKVVDVYREG